MTLEQSLQDAPNIAIIGGMGAGKTTLAEYLGAHHGYRQHNISKALYELAERIWGPQVRKERGKLQELGMKIREIDEDAWLNIFIREAIEVDDPRPVVNDTIRFRNEYWKLKELGFVFIRLLAKEVLREDRLMSIGRIETHDQMHHESETELIGLEATKAGIIDDYTVFNDGDLEFLYSQIDSLMTNAKEGDL